MLGLEVSMWDRGLWKWSGRVPRAGQPPLARNRGSSPASPGSRGPLPSRGNQRLSDVLSTPVNATAWKHERSRAASGSGQADRNGGISSHAANMRSW